MYIYTLVYIYIHTNFNCTCCKFQVSIPFVISTDESSQIILTCVTRPESRNNYQYFKHPLQVLLYPRTK